MTILDAARAAGMYIPTLRYHSDLLPDGVCRVCSVEVKGQRTLCAACVYPVSEGMEVMTHTPRVRSARRMVVELMLANHPQECLTCAKSQKCELQKLAKEVGIQDLSFKGERKIGAARMFPARRLCGTPKSASCVDDACACASRSRVLRP